MLARLQSVRRKIYLFLTTSERDVRNRKDYVMRDQRALRYERDRVQKTNDVFHKAGHQGQLLSFEALTLQFRGLAWSFLIVPSVFVTGIVLLIYLSGRDQRTSHRLQAQAVYQQRLDEAAAKRGVLAVELEEARELLKAERERRVSDEAALDAEIACLTAKLDELSALYEAKTAASTSSTSRPL